MKRRAWLILSTWAAIAGPAYAQGSAHDHLCTDLGSRAEKILAETKTEDGSLSADSLLKIRFPVEKDRGLPMDSARKYRKVLETAAHGVRKLGKQAKGPRADLCTNSITENLLLALETQVGNIRRAAKDPDYREVTPLEIIQGKNRRLEKELAAHKRYLRSLDAGGFLTWLDSADSNARRSFMQGLMRGKVDPGRLGATPTGQAVQEIVARTNADTAFRNLVLDLLHKDKERLIMERLIEAARKDSAAANQIVQIIEAKGQAKSLAMKILTVSPENHVFADVVGTLVAEAEDLEILQQALKVRNLIDGALSDSATIEKVVAAYRKTLEHGLAQLGKPGPKVAIVPPLAIGFTGSLDTVWEKRLIKDLESALRGRNLKPVSLARYDHFLTLKEELAAKARDAKEGDWFSAVHLEKLRKVFHGDGEDAIGFLFIEYWMEGKDSLKIQMQWADYRTGIILGVRTGKTRREGFGGLKAVTDNLVIGLSRSRNSELHARTFVHASLKDPFRQPKGTGWHVPSLPPIQYELFQGSGRIDARKLKYVKFCPFIGNDEGIANYKNFKTSLETRLRNFSRLTLVPSDFQPDSALELRLDGDPALPGKVIVRAYCNLDTLFSIVTPCPPDQVALQPATYPAFEYAVAGSLVESSIAAHLDILSRLDTGTWSLRWTHYLGLLPFGVSHITRAFTAEKKSGFLLSGMGLLVMDLVLGAAFYNSLLTDGQDNLLYTGKSVNERIYQGLAWGLVGGSVRILGFSLYVRFDRENFAGARAKPKGGETAGENPRLELSRAFTLPF